MVDKASLKSLAKQCLSIMPNSNMKDDEIELHVMAGVNELKRQGIDSEGKIDDDLIKDAIIMFVKANFGMLDTKDKEQAEKSFKSHCYNLSLSQEYKLKENQSD